MYVPVQITGNMAFSDKSRKVNEEKELERDPQILKEREVKFRETIKYLHDITAHASESDRKIERLEAELSCLKEKVALCQREHCDANVMKNQLETVRQNTAESERKKMKDTMQRVTSYSKAQKKEKDQALRDVASLRDKIAALKKLSAETQKRQLDEQKQQQQQRQHTDNGN